MHGSGVQARSELALRPRLLRELLLRAVSQWAPLSASKRRRTSRRDRANNAVGDRLASPSGLHGQPLAVQDALPGSFIMSLDENFIKTLIVSYRETLDDFHETTRQVCQTAAREHLSARGG